MSWEYSGDPASSEKDAVRFLIGDTDEDSQKISDEEIDWLLTQETNVYLAAAATADSIANTFGSKADKTVGSLSISYSTQQASYTSKAIQLRDEAMLRFNTPTMIFLGLRRSDKLANEREPDIEHPVFKLGQMDNKEF